jgi:hypothetical protein
MSQFVYLVEQDEIGVSFAEIEEALDTDTIVDGHADDAVVGEATALIRGASQNDRTLMLVAILVDQASADDLVGLFFSGH